MINKNALISLESDNYLIDVLISSSNKIRVFIENDEHVSIKDCIALSRFIENSLDREKEDFELEVSSPGIDQPFKSIRQYQKYKRRPVEILLNDGQKLYGELTEANEKEIGLIPNTNKNSKKKLKQTSLTDEQPAKILLADIKETKLVIVF